MKLTAPNETQNYFDGQQYETLLHYHFAAGVNIELRDHEEGSIRHCRFCHRSEFDVPYRNVAHAIPEFLGNRTVLSLNECDECNTRLAQDYEDHLSKWCLWQRVVWGVRSKKGRPTYESKDKTFRFTTIDGRPKIELTDPELLERITRQNKDDIHFSKTLAPIVSNPYVPLRAGMALLKIACSICPATELNQCQGAIDWLMGRVNAEASPFPVMICGRPEESAVRPGEIVMLRRRSESPVPYLWCVLAMGDCQIQWFVPGCPADVTWQRSGAKSKLRAAFFRHIDPDPEVPRECRVEDWSCEELVRRQFEATINVRKARITSP